MSDGMPEVKSSIPPIQEGGVYRHFKGDLYVVLAVLYTSGEDISIKVGYMSLKDGRRYWRNYYGEDGFTTPKVHEDGRTEDRFSLCGFSTVALNRGIYSVTQEFG